ncbi:integrator complex subunit 6 [Culex pipiens pallens]|uniref:integrator complex subunit 6 n=1 Tax=Culex pipiens pallens TaxID=42434 RepID=UPI001953375F|nr:integrator complex subunit 6 [Culex pipiens pallens]XP_039440128.1 integrator complex subunit 6 [Culex pipiens pallens]XP_039440129.1 integrator complex subunit 6 [Culex pipiens pallens]XP_039440130.1 integrator complex subunit 6 [Culex pipiens pallens]
MTIILFLVDTSASMCQKAHVNGVQKSYLDIAKGAVETFLKYRQRSQDCMGDRYMLLTFEDPPNNVKAGWKENHATFMNELKNLASNGLTSMGEALKNAFDLLNLNRMQSGIDTYGQGRCPFYLEPSVIIVLTDGGKYSFRNGVHQEIILPLHAQIPGTKLTKEPFRWDQRLFSLVLRMSGNRADERVDGKVPHDDSMIEKMCEVTGGRSYKIRSQYVLNQCIESLVQKVQPGVVIHFDQLLTTNATNGEGGGGADLQFQSIKRMIYVQKHPQQKTFPVGFWPIPEPYWPDPKSSSLPPRDAHPKIKIITPCCDEPVMLRNFPIDKYELEPSPLTLQILSKKETNKVWPLIVSSGMHGIEMPFGFLKPSSTMTVVNLYVLPYNYQTFLPLINDLFHKYNLNPPNDWIYKFSNYVKAIPQYYCPFLRRALATTPNVPYQLVQYILPENLDSYLSPAVANYLKQMKNTAKQDQENLCLRVFKQLKQPKPGYHQLETVKLNPGMPLKRDLISHPMLKDAFNKVHADIASFDNYTIVVPTVMRPAATKNYRNPFDIPRRDLIDEIARMRENFFRLPTSGITLYTKDSGHCLPIADMGNYQEYLKNKETPLRELEPTNVRQHMFGNPYKKDKNMVMVDEADLNEVAPMKGGRGGGGSEAAALKNRMADPNARLSRKRKAGPIRKDYTFKRKCFGLLGSSTSASSSSSSSSVTSETSASLSDFAASDSECDSASVISSSAESELDDDPDDRLVVDFEFPSDRDEDAGAVLTPHVRQFIEGPDEGGTPPEVPIAVEPTLPFHHHHHHHPHHLPPPQQQQQTLPMPPPPHHHVPTVVPIVAAAAPLPVNPILGPSGSASSTASSSLATATTNDMTSEISNILKTCHNGANSYASSQEEPPPVTPPEPDPPVTKPSKKQLKKSEPERTLLNGGDHFAPPPTPQAPSTSKKSTSAPPPTKPAELSEEERDRIREENYAVRAIVFKDIRRPGRNYSGLLEHLTQVQGDLATRSTFVEMCVREALRFRRRKMADSIEEWWDGQLEAQKQQDEKEAAAAVAAKQQQQQNSFLSFNHQGSRSRTSHYGVAGPSGSSRQFPHQPHPPNKQQPGGSKAHSNHQSRI